MTKGFDYSFKVFIFLQVNLHIHDCVSYINRTMIQFSDGQHIEITKFFYANDRLIKTTHRQNDGFLVVFNHDIEPAIRNLVKKIGDPGSARDCARES